MARRSSLKALFGAGAEETPKSDNENTEQPSNENQETPGAQEPAAEEPTAEEEEPTPPTPPPSDPEDPPSDPKETEEENPHVCACGNMITKTDMTRRGPVMTSEKSLYKVNAIRLRRGVDC